MGKAKPKKAARRAGSVLPFLAGGALVLIIVGLMALWRPAAQSPTVDTQERVTGGPRLAVDQEKIDFGPVKVEKVVKASFKLRNIGDQPLRILSEPFVQVVEGC
jgi:hypothetical protein